MQNILVIIHGLFMNPKAWEGWKTRFETEGYAVHVPAYPFHNGEPAELRQNAADELGKLSFSEVYSFFANYLIGLPGKPLLLGHSMGGLLVQKLLENGHGSAGVCICPAPPLGIFSFKWSFLASNFKVINPLKGNSVCLPEPAWYHWSVCNTLSMEDANKIYDRFVVPESRNIPRQAAKVNFSDVKPPLLIVSAEEDRVVPAVIGKRLFKAYRAAGKMNVEWKLFKGRSHIICWESGSEEVFAYILSWLNALSLH